MTAMLASGPLWGCEQSRAPIQKRYRRWILQPATKRRECDDYRSETSESGASPRHIPKTRPVNEGNMPDTSTWNHDTLERVVHSEIRHGSPVQRGPEVVRHIGFGQHRQTRP